MAKASSSSLVGYLRCLLAAWKDDARPDAELLAAFAKRGDEQAFTTLVGRHGLLVWGTCLRQVRDPHTAEDAFQATFLALAQKAARLRLTDKASLSGWLHRVARRKAIDLWRDESRRRDYEHKATPSSPDAPEQAAEYAELCGVFDEELDRLPEKYRLPLLLCQIQGRPYAEVARELGCSVTTVYERMVRGQDLLRKRLTARGLSLTAGSLAVLFATGGVNGAVPVAMSAATVAAAMAWAREGLRAPDQMAAMIWAVKLWLGKLKFGILAAGVGLLLVAGSSAFFLRSVPPANPSPTPPSTQEAVFHDARKAPAQTDGPTAVIRGKVIDAAGRAVPHAAVTALVRRPFRPGEHALRDEVVAQDRADEQGNYRLRVPAHSPTWFPERQVALVAKAPEHAALTTLVRLAEQGVTQVDLRLTAAERIIRGRLLDPDGAAASGVRLRVIRLGDVARETVQGAAEQDGPVLIWPGPVVSDTDGRFALSSIDPEQGVWLQVEDDRYAPDAFGVRGADKPAEIRLKPAQVIEGCIIAADTGEGVAGVKLTARLPGSAFNPGRFTVPDYLSVSARVLPPGSIDGVTGTDGRFRLRPPVGPKTIIEVHPPAESPYLAVCKEVVWPEGVVRQTLAAALPRGVVVQGRVVDEDGNPVAGASVQFCSPARGNPAYRPDVIEGRSRIVRAEKDGRYRLTVPAGLVQLRAHGRMARRSVVSPQPEMV